MSVSAPETYLADLNPAQREAVLTTEGPVLVIAGAGSGKTRVLTHRVAHLLAAVGAKPQEILGITFTNKAANEMRERLERLLPSGVRGLWILTFHAACGRILRREAPRLGYRTNFTIYDQADQIRLTKQCLEELERDPKRFVPRGIHFQISNAKNQLISPDEYRSRVASFYDQTVADVYDLYQRRLFASNAVDFDDILMLTVDVLERFPEALERWQKAFRYVLVDEYQDTNHAQYRLLQLLAAKHQNLFAVGDPDQSIYAFRGADIRNIMEFERDFPGTKTIQLEQNYRSTNNILSAANGVIRHNRERKEKNLWSELGEGEPVRVIEVEDEHAEARFVAASIAALVEEGFSGAEIAVFYRTNAQSRVLEVEANNFKAQADVARYKALVDKNEVSRSDYDQVMGQSKAFAASVDSARASAEAAQKIVEQRRAQLNMARSMMESASVNAPNQVAISKANLQSKQADVQAMKAQLDRALLDLSYCKIIAPVAGVITKRTVEAGEHVSKGQRLVTLSDLGDLWVTANFKESQLRQMHPGQSVTISVDAFDQNFDGSIEAMPGSTGSITSLLPPENASGNYVKVVQRLPVRIRFKPGQQGFDRLRPGMSVVPKVWLK